MMTLEKFRASRRECDDLGTATCSEFYDEHGKVVKRAGYLYDGDCYVEKMDDGQLYLILFRDEYLVSADRLDELELRLYEWALTECSWDEVDEDEKRDIVIGVHFANELQRTIGTEKFDEVRALNKAEEFELVCHSHDFCDANVVMMQAAKDALMNLLGWDTDPEENFGNFMDICGNAWNAARPLLGRNAT